MSGTSTLDPDNFPTGRDRSVGKGHGTGALGPSDTSDSGSDIAGGTASQEVGDANLDSDSDSGGTGERASAGRDTTVEAGRDISVDHVIGPNGEGTDEDLPAEGEGTDEDIPGEARREEGDDEDIPR